MPDQERPLDAELVRLVQRLWEPPPPSRRGPKASLSIERIVDAAIALADAEGIGAVSMARLGKALGVSPMALYRHVGSKDELLAHLTDRIAADLPDLPTEGTWRERLERWMRVQIDLALARPWFLDLPLSTVMPGPQRLRWIDQAFGILADLPLTADEKFAIIGLLAQHVLGESRVQIEAARAGGEPYSDLAVMLGQFADPDAYPHLVSAFAHAPAPASGDPEDEIAFGIHVVLDGVAAYVARKQE
ncbi:TetR/AcrR family transcriptional regulator [Xylanimonas allomyrinae]|uniref:TetR/AcrR family transcriptional regulator n=1 Tax=Xylanimonas allomyrinae TaxID=2509459 RepID=A0A4P6ERB5_9MICO|nr:TetR/AcrR family transcriptional regulator [Xylanimonas allomyrinae]QAY64039.1 TetR/AcrR family transcriptional regulator [Xylanimonas allomyrinae]